MKVGLVSTLDLIEFVEKVQISHEIIIIPSLEEFGKRTKTSHGNFSVKKIQKTETWNVGWVPFKNCKSCQIFSSRLLGFSRIACRFVSSQKFRKKITIGHAFIQNAKYHQKQNV